MEGLVKSFDDDLQAMAERKRTMSVELRYADISIITLYEQLQVVQLTQVIEDKLRINVERLGGLVRHIEKQVLSQMM